MKGIKRRGISPVVATVLLIAIVIILAIIIFLWARGFISEKAQKFERAIELSCDEVNFEAGVVLIEDNECIGYNLDIVNRGDIPLYGFVIKTLGAGSVVIIEEILGETITIGKSATLCLGTGVEPGTDLLIVPKILGETESGLKVAHTCRDEQGRGAYVPPLLP